MADSQRAKAAALVDSDVMTLGRETQRTRKTTNPVAQANMSRQGPANPQPRLTPTDVPFAKGGSAKGKAKKAAAVAGMLSALTRAPVGGPAPAGMGAPPPMAGPPMAGPPGMKRGGKAYAKGGKVHGDEAEDKKLFKRMFKSEEAKEGPEKMKSGGKVCAKCGGRMSAGHMCGGGKVKMASGGAVPRNKAGRTAFAQGGPARQKFAVGGPGKMRKGEMTPAGQPTKPKRSSTNNLI